MDDGGTVVPPTVATAAEGPHHAQRVAGLLFDVMSGWFMPSVRRHHRAAMAGACSQLMERHGDANADGAVVVGEDEEEDDDDNDPYGGWLLGAEPASGDAVAALPETTVREGAAGDEEEECCAVCLEEYVSGDALRTLPCKHGFHGRCILGWLSVSRLCPLCRFALPAEAGTDSDSEEEERDHDEEDDGTLEPVLSLVVTESGDEAGTP